MCVVVPTRGERPDLLDISIGSLLAQTLRPRIVVVTQGDAHDLSRRFQGDVEVISQVGSGLSAAINQGWEHDRWSSQLTAWLGDDDALPPWSLAAAAEVLERRTEAVAVHGRCLVIDMDGRPVWAFRNGRVGAALLGYGHHLIAQPGALFRTRALQALGGLDTSLRLAMDVDLFLRLKDLGPIASCPQQLGVFRVHAGGLSAAGYDAARDEATAAMRRRRPRPLLHRVATPLTRATFALNRLRPPPLSTYWHPPPPPSAEEDVAAKRR